MKNIKVWKKIKKSNYKNVQHLLKDLIQKKYVLSPWISNIFNNKKNNISINNQSYDLYKIKVRSLGFKKATKLKYISNKKKVVVDFDVSEFSIKSIKVFN